MEDQTNTAQVYASFAKAMAGVRSVGKSDFNSHQKFKFRGVDAVMNAVGPALRDNDLFLIPEVVSHSLEPVRSSQGKAMVQAVVNMRYTVAHASGGTFSGQAVGEATDHADKATSKATSVALRTFLIQSMVLPTDETDPDHEFNERGNAPQPEQLLYQSPGWNAETASRPQLGTAVRQAESVGDMDTAARLSNIGRRRFMQ